MKCCSEPTSIPLTCLMHSRSSNCCSTPHGHRLDLHIRSATKILRRRGLMKGALDRYFCRSMTIPSWSSSRLLVPFATALLQRTPSQSQYYPSTLSTPYPKIYDARNRRPMQSEFKKQRHSLDTKLQSLTAADLPSLSTALIFSRTCPL